MRSSEDAGTAEATDAAKTAEGSAAAVVTEATGAADTADAESRYRSNYRWVVVGLTLLAQTVMSAVYMGVPTLAPYFQASFNLSHAQLGLLSAAMNFGTVSAMLAAGIAVDSLGERRVIGIGGVATGLAALGAAWAPGFGLLFALLVLAGVFYSTGTPGGGKAISAWFPPEERGFAIGIRQTGVPLGGVVAAAIISWLAASADWHQALLGIGLTSIAGSLVAYAGYREPAAIRGGSGQGDEAGLTAVLAEVRSLLTNRNLLLTSLGALVLVASQMIVVTYLALSFRDRLGLPTERALAYLVGVQLSGVIGRILWGYASDRLFRASRRDTLFVIAGLAALVASLMAVFVEAGGSPPAWLLGLVAVAFGLTTVGWNGVYIALIAELSGTRRAGRGLGLSLTIIQLGVLAGPPLFGWLVDLTGSYTPAWGSLAAALLLSATIIRQVREGLPHGVAHQES